MIERVRSARRGQLLLVGAGALAVNSLGLTVVINTVLFTENVGTGEARVESPAIQEFTFEAQKGSRSLLLRLNAADRTQTLAEVNASVRGQIGNYSDALGRSYAASGTVFVDTTYNETLRNGTRIVQGVDRNFTYPASHAGLGSNRSDWSPVVDPTEIGWLVFNVDLRNTSGDQTTVEVSGDSETLTYRLNRARGGDGADLRVSVTGPSTSETTACESVGGRVLLDGRTGEAFLGECTFPGIETIDPPYSISIVDGDNLAGQYDIIVNETWHSSPSRTIDAGDGGTVRPYEHCPTGGDAPCLAPVVWQGQIDLVYRSSDVDYATTRNVSVYDP